MDNTKITLIGSSIEQVLESAKPDPKRATSTKSNVKKDDDEAPKYQSEQKEHKKIIEKGLPSDAEVGDKEKNVITQFLTFRIHFQRL